MPYLGILSLGACWTQTLAAVQQVNGVVDGKINHFPDEGEALELELKNLGWQKQMLELQIKEFALQLELKRFGGSKLVAVN